MLTNKKNVDLNAVAHYCQEYQRVEKKLIGQRQKKLNRLRLDALEQFSAHGFPSKKHADWKYTSLTALCQTPYSLSMSTSDNDMVTTLLGPLNGDYRLVFVNGFFAAHLSTIPMLTDNSIISNLCTMLNQYPEQLNATWKPKETVAENCFTYLNTAFMQDGVYIYLAANTRLCSPIEILFINTDEISQRFIPLRNIIIAEENSQATIIEKYIDMTRENNANYFTNTVTECHLAANSHIEHYKAITESKQAQHVGNLCVTQQQQSQFSAYSLALSGALIRSDVTVKLLASDAHCQLKGLYYAVGQQQVDHTTQIDHASPHTRSEEFYKGIIDDRARAAFNGKVIVREQAIKSKAQQLNKNLLLSPFAEVNSKPQLEIFADDIQCTHGASVGQLDKDALFYLRTRGLSISAATELLVKAFIQDIIEQMPLFNAVTPPRLIKKLMKTFDVKKIRTDFPILQQKIKGKSLVYLDNAASTQKPRSVIERLNYFYRYENSNVHRGIHTLSELATEEFELSREKIQQFIHAKSFAEIIFVRGTTEAINLVAQTYGLSQIKAGDEIIISHMEHHANIVPWQILCAQTGAKLKVIPINDAGELLLEEYQRLLNQKTKLVAICHISNTLGTINPIKQIIDSAHANSPNTKVLIDGAQAVAHQKVDVQALDCDFYVFSGHKLFAPTGIGVLYGKQELLAAMPPYQGGGSMITEVTLEKSYYREPPYKFEAGTPHIAGAIGLGAAIDYLNQLDFDAIHLHEQQLLDYASQNLQTIQDLRLIGTAKEKAAILNFTISDSHGIRIHGHDISDVLNAEAGVAVRAGQHCTMPLMQRFNVDSTVRASLAFYNNKADIDALIDGLLTLKQLFK